MDKLELSALAEALKRCCSDRERIEVLDRQPRVQTWLQSTSWLRTFSTLLNFECELVVKSLVAIGQHEELFCSGDERAEKLRGLIEELLPVEMFYKEMGGIVGYHWTMLSLLSQASGGGGGESMVESRLVSSPPGVDISSETAQVRQFILDGIIFLPSLAEIYPVGGAADRLRFCDPQCGQPLPAAKLYFCGKTLLEGLVCDLQAREYLYYKLFGEQTLTPIAMMTSVDKDNHSRIVDLCEEQHWFGRPKELFRFFCQPLVPTMDRRGEWCLSGPMKFLMKPGGHGVIWKVAKDEGVLDWLQDLGRTKMLVRQINNPIAAVDYGLLAFCGLGFCEDKTFGFASCPRQVRAAEGINVLFERVLEDRKEYCLTSIEYCDFSKFSIQDRAEHLGSSYSRFPSNTNILFADIASVKEAVQECPIPGMLVNLKPLSFVDAAGNPREQEVARLESTMQNIADCFQQEVAGHMPTQDVKLQTYLTYNHRRKTISTAKKMLLPGAGLLETPEGCHYDLLVNAYDLLTNYCHFDVPQVPDAQGYIEQGPPFLFSYHPAIGPLFSIIGQKLRGGAFSERSEMRLEIAELEMVNLTLTGSLHVIAEQVMGESDAEGILRYSERSGKCRLIDVTVRNRGVDWSAQNSYWMDAIERLEVCEIHICGDGEFVATGVTLTGGISLRVETGTRVTAFEEAGQLKFKTEPLLDHSEGWIYHLAEDGSIVLE